MFRDNYPKRTRLCATQRRQDIPAGGLGLLGVSASGIVGARVNESLADGSFTAGTASTAVGLRFMLGDAGRGLRSALRLTPGVSEPWPAPVK